MKTPNINGKTPEEIKKGLEEAEHIRFVFASPTESGGSWQYGVMIGYALRDAICDYIQQLESRLAQAERERDAAIRDIPRYCKYCVHNHKKSKHNVKRSACAACLMGETYGFEWRGVCAENTNGGD